MYPTKEHLMYIKQVLTNNRKIDSNTVVGYFDTPLTSVNRSSAQKIPCQASCNLYIHTDDSWESLGLQGDQPVHSKGDQSWVFIGRTDAEAETPILWPPHAKSWLIGKDPDAGRDWEQEKKGMTENEMAGWHHRLDGHEFGWTPGNGGGQGGLACCNSWGSKESDMT